jgi:hypothetical protein
MNDSHSQKIDECQLRVVFSPGEALTVADKLRNMALRPLSAFKRRMPENRAAPKIN